MLSAPIWSNQKKVLRSSKSFGSRPSITRTGKAKRAHTRGRLRPLPWPPSNHPFLPGLPLGAAQWHFWKGRGAQASESTTARGGGGTPAKAWARRAAFPSGLMRSPPPLFRQQWKAMGKPYILNTPEKKPAWSPGKAKQTHMSKYFKQDTRSHETFKSHSLLLRVCAD